MTAFIAAQRLILAITAASLMLIAAAPALGQQFPNRSIRIVASGPGGGADASARLIAQQLTQIVGQQVIVENHVSSQADMQVANAAPDGYTLLLDTSTLWIGPLLRKSSAYDPVKDFAPVTQALSFPLLMVINAAVPANSVKEFIALAKAKPGQINYVMASVGSSSHIAAELFKSLAGVDLTGVSYKVTSTGILDLLSGRVHVFFSAAGPMMPHVKTGKLKALGVSTAKPSTLFPDLPTVAATVPGYETVPSYSIFAPAKTPPAIINQLNRDIARAVRSPELKERIFENGFEVVASSPQELAALRAADMVRIAKLIKDANIPLQE